jgi:tRNA uridine 5-carboxymethylaminomethyl modification enzyme
VFHVEHENNKYDVAVIGAGHAGAEASMASAKIGAKTLLLTISLDSVGFLPCNSSIGGPGRGHLVREIAALGGLMGKTCDNTYIHSRMLNISKGPAVQALRKIVDKRRYSMDIKRQLEDQKGLHLRQGLAVDISRSGSFYVIKTSDGLAVFAKCIVVCAGTFLRAKIFWGDFSMQAGRHGEIASVKLAKSLEELGMRFGRLKTDTPPRLDKKSIDFDFLEAQPYDKEPRMFSFDPVSHSREQVNSYITYVEDDAISIIKKNIDHSPSYTGEIISEGPKYCPSIEDKVQRFPHKSRHMLFLQPEGKDTNEIYVHGLSTSLPEETQIKVIRNIKGLENAMITRPGYGVEYDYLLPQQVDFTLQSRGNKNLFFAGQVNGTTGYEEAAAQGIVAGINAALSSLGKNKIHLKRSDGYIGLLIDELNTKEITQPYRMLTSRNESRLIHRHDNADKRMINIIKAIGDEKNAVNIEKKYARIAQALKEVKTGKHFVEDDILQKIMSDRLDEEEKRSMKKTLSLTETEIENLLIEIKYEKHIKREEKRLLSFENNANVTIPEDIQYGKIKNLSSEAIISLEKKRPLNIGQALRLEGVNRTDAAILYFYLEKVSRETT